MATSTNDRRDHDEAQPEAQPDNVSDPGLEGGVDAPNEEPASGSQG
jgi:hypothetical protein